MSKKMTDERTMLRNISMSAKFVGYDFAGVLVTNFVFTLIPLTNSI